MKQISATSFKNKLKQFCELKGYIFNPKDQLTDKAGQRIMKWTDSKTEEHFFIQVQEESAEESAEETNNEQDDIFF